MKQSLFLFSLFTLLILSGCSKEDDEKSSLDKTSITLNRDKSIQLNVSTGNNSVNWKCEDQYVASVSSSGLVTGNRVGKTFVTANDLKCEVIVDPVYNLYEDPITDWTMTKEQVQAKLGKPYQSTSNTLVYETSNSKAPIVAYAFENGKLKGVLVSVDLLYSIDCANFLGERYAVYATVDDNDLVAILGNSLDEKKATVIVGMSLKSSYILVTYIPNTHTKSTDITIKGEIERLSNIR